jgi:hypothetical protein
MPEQLHPLFIGHLGFMDGDGKLSILIFLMNNGQILLHFLLFFLLLPVNDDPAAFTPISWPKQGQQ